MNKQITKSQLLAARDKLLVISEVVPFALYKTYLNRIVALLDDIRLNEARPA